MRDYKRDARRAEGAEVSRPSLLERVLSKSPNCIYCGGVHAASTVDHAPPRIIFVGKDRPPGLEFAACEECNAGARLDELAVGFVSRAYPDPRTPEEVNDLNRCLTGIGNNWPGLLAEMKPSRDQIQDVLGEFGSPDLGALNCRGPILNGIMLSYAAKMCFAMHFETVGRAVPPRGGASVLWLSNVQRIKGEMPTALLNLLPPGRTLQQGRKHVAEVFGYSSLKTDDGSMSAHFATFRGAFAVCGFVANDDMELRDPNARIYRPGWLKQRPNARWDGYRSSYRL